MLDSADVSFWHFPDSFGHALKRPLLRDKQASKFDFRFSPNNVRFRVLRSRV
jgi:hypothetical protein